MILWVHNNKIFFTIIHFLCINFNMSGKKGRFLEKTGNQKGQETTPVPFVTYEALRICGIFLYLPNN